ncbi:MAG: biotin synthase BioB [Muribaculaceae bacterium]|nr:biotin synthase BioB [Muribaculaceae bacterium]
MSGTVEMVAALRDRVLSGGSITPEEAYALADITDSEGVAALRDAAAEVTARMVPRTFDSCSIVNARSGRCSENCKWCAQSAHWSTGCDTYDIVDEDECMAAARHNAARGVRRFSLVASGRAVKGAALTRIAAMLRRAKEETGISTCASLGLIGRDELQELWDAGVRRYHCNLEAAPSHFATLCTTHTVDDKLATIAAAREIGFEVCSGGIIGMGETARQRAELAVTLRAVCPVSIPVNVLCPIPGTPLADMDPISEDDIINTVAVFRMVHPTVQIRFAGGRMRLSREAQVEAMRVGVNGGITGDLLTTTGTTIDGDRQLAADAGYDF